MPIFLTPAFEMEFNRSMQELEILREQVKKQKEVIDMFLDKVYKNKMLLNNPDLLDLYLKIKRCQND